MARSAMPTKCHQALVQNRSLDNRLTQAIVTIVGMAGCLSPLQPFVHVLAGDALVQRQLCVDDCELPVQLLRTAHALAVVFACSPLLDQQSPGNALATLVDELPRWLAYYGNFAPPLPL